MYFTIKFLCNYLSDLFLSRPVIGTYRIVKKMFLLQKIICNYEAIKLLYA